MALIPQISYQYSELFLALPGATLHNIIITLPESGSCKITAMVMYLYSGKN